MRRCRCRSADLSGASRLFVSAHDGAHLWGDPAAADGVGQRRRDADDGRRAAARRPPRAARELDELSADEDFGMLLEALTALDGELAKAETVVADAAPAHASSPS